MAISSALPTKAFGGDAGSFQMLSFQEQTFPQHDWGESHRMFQEDTSVNSGGLCVSSSPQNIKASTNLGNLICFEYTV